jgi:hypothetical protein
MKAFQNNKYDYSKDLGSCAGFINNNHVNSTGLCIDIPNTFCNIFRDSFAEKHAHDVLHELRACGRAWYIFLFFLKDGEKKS